MSKIRKYRDELLKLSDKIRTDFSVSISDIKRLESLYKLCGISEETIKDIYQDCGFNTWEDYIKTKRRNDFSQWEYIECVDDNIQIVTGNILHYTSSMAND